MSCCVTLDSVPNILYPLDEIKKQKTRQPTTLSKLEKYTYKMLGVITQHNRAKGKNVCFFFETAVI